MSLLESFERSCNVIATSSMAWMWMRDAFSSVQLACEPFKIISSLFLRDHQQLSSSLNRLTTLQVYRGMQADTTRRESERADG